MMSSIYTTLNNKRVSPYNTTLGSRSTLILEPRSTPFSHTNFSDFKFFGLNSQLLKCSIHRVHGSTKPKMSTLASSTLEHLHLWSHKLATIIKCLAHLKPTCYIPPSSPSISQILITHRLYHRGPSLKSSLTCHTR